MLPGGETAAVADGKDNGEDFDEGDGLDEEAELAATGAGAEVGGIEDDVVAEAERDDAPPKPVEVEAPLIVELPVFVPGTMNW